MHAVKPSPPGKAEEACQLGAQVPCPDFAEVFETKAQNHDNTCGAWRAHSHFPRKQFICRDCLDGAAG